MSLATDAKDTLPQLASADPTERAAGYAMVTTLFVNGNGRDLAIAEIVLPALFTAVEHDPHALAPLATAAHGLFGARAYPEALRCIEVLLADAGSGEALSRKDAPWDDRAEPFTRERERALFRLFRYECLLAAGRLEDAAATLPEALAGAAVLPTPFKLSPSIYEWGTPDDFVLRARIRASRALRLWAAGRDAAAFRKVPKKLHPKPVEAKRIRGLARALTESYLPELDASLSRFAPYTPGIVPDLTVADKRALQDFRAEGYAEAGMIARDEGDSTRAARLLATAHWILSIHHHGLGPGVEPDHREAILALAPTPALVPATRPEP
ncbi:MAG: hypothetical protein IPJ34_32355 [Myxococcales bacterium]|nr:hypothetical protein [Myxococcales bacterium]